MDMYMKNLKPLIFSAHSELKTSHSEVQKSHLYEAFAAFCGFKSYAAFQAASIVEVDDIKLANIRCFDRMKHIGFDVNSAFLISKCIKKVWEKYDVISLEEVYTFYNKYLCEETIEEKRILETLRSFVCSDNRDATLMGIVFAQRLLTKYKEVPDNRSGEYWYKKLLANNELSSMHRLAAEEYKDILPYQDFLEFLRSKLDKSYELALPSPSIIKPICQQFDDGITRHWTHYFKYEYLEVADAFELYNEHASTTVSPALRLDWLKAQAIIDPDEWTIFEIIEQSSESVEEWFWYYWGLEHDIDVTQGNLYAINSDTGEEYDNYGPCEVAGYEGIALPEISAKEKLNAKNLIKQIESK